MVERARAELDEAQKQARELEKNPPSARLPRYWGAFRGPGATMRRSKLILPYPKAKSRKLARASSATQRDSISIQRWQNFSNNALKWPMASALSIMGWRKRSRSDRS